MAYPDDPTRAPAGAVATGQPFPEPAPSRFPTFRRLYGGMVSELSDDELIGEYGRKYGLDDPDRIAREIEARAMIREREIHNGSMLPTFRKLYGEKIGDKHDDALLADYIRRYPEADLSNPEHLAYVVKEIEDRARREAGLQEPSTPERKPLLSQNMLANQALWAKQVLDAVTNAPSAIVRGYKGGQQSGRAGAAATNAHVLNVLDALDRGASDEELHDLDPSQYHTTLAIKQDWQDPAKREQLRARAIKGLAEQTADVVRLGQEIAALPRDPEAEAFTQANTFGEAWDRFWKDPLGIVSQVGFESFVRSAPALAAGGAGAILTRSPLGGAIGQYFGSKGIEAVASILEALEEHGVDTSDPAQIETAMRNPALLAQVRQRAETRGTIIGALDAASMGVAGKTIAPAGIKSKLARELINLGVQTNVQGALGAAGEAGAQLATTGELKPGEIAAEYVGEFFGAPAEVAAMARARRQAAGTAGGTTTTEAAPEAAGEPGAQKSPVTSAPPDPTHSTGEDEIVAEEPNEAAKTEIEARDEPDPTAAYREQQLAGEVPTRETPIGRLEQLTREEAEASPRAAEPDLALLDQLVEDRLVEQRPARPMTGDEYVARQFGEPGPRAITDVLEQVPSGRKRATHFIRTPRPEKAPGVVEVLEAHSQGLTPAERSISGIDDRLIERVRAIGQVAKLPAKGVLGYGKDFVAVELDGGHVLKVAKERGGYMPEDAGERPFDAPIIARGDGWHIQPKVSMDTTPEQRRAFAKEVEAAGYTFVDPGKYQMGLVDDAGELAGRMVLIDYGAVEKAQALESKAGAAEARPPEPSIDDAEPKKVKAEEAQPGGFATGERVWIRKNGKVLSGSVRSGYIEGGRVDVNVDQIAAPGGVPLRRIESWPVDQVQRGEPPSKEADEPRGASRRRPSDMIEPKAPPEEAPARLAAVPFSQLRTDPKRFQPREAAFSEESARRIAENFDPRELDPLRVWKDPKSGEWMILAGHSRYEGLRRLIEAGKLPEDYAVPVDVYEGTEEEAIDFALRENEKGTSLMPHEQAEYIRRMIGQGSTKKAIRETADRLYGKNARTIISLAHLNPKGTALMTLRQFASVDSKDARDALTMATWVGKLREAYPDLTNQHEEEITKHLLQVYNKRDFATAYENFASYFKEVLDRRTLMGELPERINFDEIKPQTMQEQLIEQQVLEAREAWQQAEKEYEQAKKVANERYRREHGTDMPEHELVKETSAEAAYALRMKREYERLLMQKDGAKQAARQAQRSLFDVALSNQGFSDEQIDNAAKAPTERIEELERATQSAERTLEDPEASRPELEAAAGQLEQQISEVTGAPAPADDIPTPEKKPTVRERAADKLKANTKYTDDDAARAREIIRRKLGGQLNMGLDPELLQAGITLAGYYVERGARTFQAYTAVMLEDLGDVVRPYLRQWYEALRYEPGFDTEGMSTAAEIDQAQEPSVSTEGATRSTPQPGDTQSPEVQDGDENDLRGAEGQPDVAPASELDAGERAAASTPAPPRRRAGDLFGQQDQAGDAEPGTAGAEGGVARPGLRAGDGRPDRAGGRARPGEPARATGRPDDKADQKRAARVDRNFRITEETKIEPAGIKSRIRANLRAIETLKTIEAANRKATPNEQAILAQFSGWGAMPQVFDETQGYYLENRSARNFLYGTSKSRYENWYRQYGETYEKLNPKLGGLLTEQEWYAAKASTLNAHYTSKEVISGLWAIVQHLGVSGGTVLEPSAGVGHIIGMMPDALRDTTRVVGIELDSLTGRILKQLYPDADIQVTGFEKSQRTANNTADLVIGNFPFGNYPVTDLAHPDYSGWSIHNYFLARSIDVLRPGGVLVAITSRYTLDALDSKVRQYVSGKADLVGAIRLPETAFKATAGTEVVTDIVVFRKKDATPFEEAQAFQYSMPITVDETEVSINEYFIAHPEMVLGTHATTGKMYAASSYTLKPDTSTPLADQIRAAMANLPADIAGEGSLHVDERPQELVLAEAGTKPGSLVEHEGKVMQVSDQGTLEAPEFAGTPARVERARAFIGLRDTLKDLINLQLSEAATDDQIRAGRDELNRVYDRFVAKHGPVSTAANSFLSDDPEFPLVLGLEIAVSKAEEKTVGGRKVLKTHTEYVKAPIFTRRTIFPRQDPTSADTIGEAVTISLNYRGGIDPAYIGRLLGITTDEARAQVIEEELAFVNPETGLLEPPDVYLSGQVRRKLKAAQVAAEQDEAFARNVKALEKVQPEPIPIDMIYVRLGSSWLPSELVQAFIEDELQVKADVHLVRTSESTSWSVIPKSGQYGARNTSTYGVAGKTGLDLVEDALNLKLSEVTMPDPNDPSGKRRMRDPEATLQAQEKQRQLQEKFNAFVKENDQWARHVEDLYNTQFNGLALPEYRVPDFDYFPGASHDIKLRDHQKRVVARNLRESTLMAHAVGTGKTYSLITTAMEMRRLGLAKKPLIVVQGATLDQFAASFRRLYPTANILVPTQKDREATSRQRLTARIATGDYDAVIIPHSFFNLIENDPQREKAYIQEQLDEIERAITEADDNPFERSSRRKDPRVKELERIKKRIEARLEKVLTRIQQRSDKVLTFEQMGIDALLIDEAHAYKRSSFVTKMSNVKGIDTDSSQRSMSLLMKIRWVHEKTNGRNVILATGTPISNTMAEAWTMMRYVRPDLLEVLGVTQFDDFASAFGDVIASFEETETGDFKQVMRFAKFVNGPELLTAWRMAADVIVNEDVNLPGVPKIKGGGPTELVIPRPKAIAAAIEEIRDERRAWDKLTGKEKREQSHVPIVLFGKARKVAIDLRLVDPRNPDIAGSKTNRAVDEIYQRWLDTKETKGTQLVFSDLFQSPEVDGQRFNLFEDLRDKLIARGIPAGEIAIIHDYNNDAKRLTLFDKVNAGEVRVLMGTTERLGVGVNVQQRLVALHHLDVPLRPMDFEQRNGRIVRQGNENEEVEILVYGVKRTLDSTSFQRLQIKQKFINQVLRGDIKDRTFDDPADDTQLTFEDMMAAFSGNPLVRERFGLENEIRQLEALEHQHTTERRRAIAQVRQMESEVLPSIRRAIEQNQPVIDQLAKAFPERKATAVVHDGQTHTEKLGEVTARILQRALDRLHGDVLRLKQKAAGGITEEVFESMAGPGSKSFTERVRLVVNGLPVDVEATVWLDGAKWRKSRQIEIGSEDFDWSFPDLYVLRSDGLMEAATTRRIGGTFKSPAGFLTSLYGALDRVSRINDELTEQQRRVEDNLAELKSKTDRPFEHANRLAQSRERLDEVLAALEAATDEDESRTIVEPDGDEGDIDYDRAPGVAERKRAGGEKTKRGNFARTGPGVPAAAPSSVLAYGSTPVQLGGWEAVHPLEMPELVRLVKELTDMVPSVRQIAGATGHHKAGKLTLDWRLFQDREQALKTLAHEIGHLVDFLPDKTMSRGNILGRLRTLRDWMAKTIGPGDVAIDPEVRRKQRAFYLRQELLSSGITRKDWLGMTPDQRKPILQRVQKSLDEWLSDQGYTTEGQVRDELYALSKWWRPFDENSVSPDYLEYRKGSKELYADALSVLLNSPGELEKRAPVFWREFWKHLDRKPDVQRTYFELQAELQGDQHSIMEKRRDTVRGMADRGEDLNRQLHEDRKARAKNWMYRTWMHYVDRFWPIIAKVNELEKNGLTIAASEDPRVLLDELNMKDNTNFLLLQKVGAIVDRIEKAGLTTTDLHEYMLHDRIINEKQETAASKARAEAQLKAGVDPEQVELEREYTGRAVLANPGGFTPKESQETLDYIRDQLGEEKWTILQEAVKEFHQIVFESVEEAVRVGTYNKAFFNEVIAPNKDHYASFRVLDHVEHPDYVSAGLAHQRGTLKDVDNVFTATLLKTISLNRLNAIQRAKNAWRDLWKQQFPSEIRKAKRTGPMTFERPGAGQGEVMILEDGKRVVYHTDEWIAKALEMSTPSEIGFATRIVEALNRGVFRPLFITYNSTFGMWFNPNRDIKRFYKNTDASMREVFRYYVKAWRPARAYVKGQADKTIQEMLANFAVVPPLSTYVRGGDALRDDTIGRLMQRFHLAPREHTWDARVERSKALKLLVRVLSAPFRFVANASGTLEVMSKIAGYQLALDRGLDAQAAAHFTRNKVGTPNFTKGGTHTRRTNAWFLFSNVFIQGLRTDLAIATNPKTRGAWLMKTAMIDIAPKLIMKAATLGLLGGALKEWFERIPEYDKTNYLCVPVPPFVYRTDKSEQRWKAVYLRVPHDETARVLAGLVWKVSNVLEGKHKGMTDLLAFGAGNVPALAPGVEIGSAWGQYAVGINPYDPFYGRNILPQKVHDAGGLYGFGRMVEWTANQLNLTRFANFDERRRTKGEYVFSITPLLGRAVKVSDYGIIEKQRREIEEEASEKARIRLGYGDQVSAAMREYMSLQRLGVERRNAIQAEKYAILSSWYSQVYRPIDEAVMVLLDEGEKAEAELLKKELDTITAELLGEVDQVVKREKERKRAGELLKVP